ncbi:MAG: FGGY family carbohydrate kinase [Ignavibacteriales bacterium]|nr:FGGY family carbohydrate kinase [Ignavibacteriales bacterium]
MYTIGYDVGSSFVKAALVDVERGTVVAKASYPDKEMLINAPVPGWAEQDPATWWKAVKGVTGILAAQASVSLKDVKAIGISYQMHGLVLVGKDGTPLRPSIIWCDSRATEIGRAAFSAIGETVCLNEMLNSPGNFTASKLCWVRQNEPSVYEKAYKMLLPGDYIALRLTGECRTTISGLSEGILWDFPGSRVAERLLSHYQLRKDLLADLVPSIGLQGYVSAAAALELGLKAGIPVSYRAGDQPNNALSLNVLEPGEIAATAGTSGVVYTVSGNLNCDPQSRINAFAHVNHRPEAPRVGILLCINGTGISNSWTRKLIGESDLTYDQMNQTAALSPVGSKGLSILPFGNGAERMLGDRDIGAQLHHLNFNIHGKPEVLRAVQEGVVFSFKYGIDIMRSLKIQPTVLKAGAANMFLSPVFCKTLASVAGVTIELYNTDGAQGAARAAAVGAGIVPHLHDAFKGLAALRSIEPETNKDDYLEAYSRWLAPLKRSLQS